MDIPADAIHSAGFASPFYFRYPQEIKSFAVFCVTLDRFAFSSGDPDKDRAVGSRY